MKNKKWDELLTGSFDPKSEILMLAIFGICHCYGPSTTSNSSSSSSNNSSSNSCGRNHSSCCFDAEYIVACCLLRSQIDLVCHVTA